ncbi:hypothetical protein M231_00443 [Tremella mesenterica]|uniref:Association with the SNF1 complex (ASC) domain-containing protein n=1 Tax=Tremella mesenterica TaxID=5217 RepID=A0A4Q1BVM5_TREME|nr:hypothetical protein M231_00443 [Tremella mesenterica]
MGNTPSNSNSPSRSNLDRPSPNDRRSSSRQPNLRLPMPSRPPSLSPTSSNPTSPSGRSNSPRRRKSLELPDLNRLAFTPAAAPVVTIATHTSHLQPTGHTKRPSDVAATSVPSRSGSRRWPAGLGTRSPLGGMGLSPMSKLDANAPMSAPVVMPNPSVSPSRATPTSDNPFFPTSPLSKDSDGRGVSPNRAMPIPIPGKGTEGSVRKSQMANLTPPRSGMTAPEKSTTQTPSEPVEEEQANDGLVAVPIQWTQGGRKVFVTGTFADNWKNRIPLRKSTHDFNTVLRLAPGEYRLKFIVDDGWRCSKSIPTATDSDGTLVNYIEVEPLKTVEDEKAEWAMAVKPTIKEEDDSKWTNIIPPSLTLYQYLEELPSTFTSREAANSYFQSVPYLSPVPQPPMLPRILERVIVNGEPRHPDDPRGTGMIASQMPAGHDDNSILAVPNHVVLNHLTASAIKNGTLGVGTTTRYRQKYITTMFFKPTQQDLHQDQVTPM